MPRTPSKRTTGTAKAKRAPRRARNDGPASCILREDSPEYGAAPPRFSDLFCGIGGFRIAFERAGGRCVFSSDYDRFSQQTYEANFGEKPHGDIHTVAVADIPAHDILCGGFPCQPFSIAGVSKKLSLGRKHGFEDIKQGNLFFSIADILDFHRPRRVRPRERQEPQGPRRRQDLRHHPPHPHRSARLHRLAQDHRRAERRPPAPRAHLLRRLPRMRMGGLV